MPVFRNNSCRVQYYGSKKWGLWPGGLLSGGFANLRKSLDHFLPPKRLDRPPPCMAVRVENTIGRQDVYIQDACDRQGGDASGRCSVSETSMNYWCGSDFAPGSVWCIATSVRWAPPISKPDAWGITPHHSRQSWAKGGLNRYSSVRSKLFVFDSHTFKSGFAGLYIHKRSKQRTFNHCSRSHKRCQVYHHSVHVLSLYSPLCANNFFQNSQKIQEAQLWQRGRATLRVVEDPCCHWRRSFEITPLSRASISSY